MAQIKDYYLIQIGYITQWRSQNIEEGRLLDQAVILFNCVPLQNGIFS